MTKQRVIDFLQKYLPETEDQLVDFCSLIKFAEDASRIILLEGTTPSLGTGIEPGGFAWYVPEHVRSVDDIVHVIITSHKSPREDAVYVVPNPPVATLVYRTRLAGFRGGIQEP